MTDAPDSTPLPSQRPSTAVSLALAVWLCVIALAVAAPRAQDADAHPKLPAGEGRDVMIRVCSQCHEPEWAAEYGNDEKAWRATVEQMRRQGAQATDAEFDQIVKYLATAFPPK